MKLGLIIFVLTVLTVTMVIFNKSVTMPSQERCELTQDSLSVYIGKEIIIDSVTHVLVNFDVLKNEYTTDKDITMSFQFVDYYFKSRDSITVGMDSPTTKIDTNE